MKTNTWKKYERIQQRTLTDLRSEGYLLRHKKSGARILLLENDDENKVFSIGFRTPPNDSTGVAHILEHSVLCGSENFPVKDPFVELEKGSLNTFLNAMTFPDKTVYPVASCNDKDFQNLMHVYLDAVFYPNIYRHSEIFRQEGWSYRLDEEDGELTYNGVVYNEMKGAFSSPEGVLDRVVINTLFPDTAYANESGGDPDVIPELTYGQFLDFHRKYYHPSNSYIYLYGNMDMEEKLNWLDEAYLSKFDSLQVDSQICLQKPFAAVKEAEIPYSISSNEPEKDNTYLSYSKVIGTSLDRELYQAFQVLDYALLSAPGAPLKKALVDAGIGKDIMGSYDNSICQPTFTVIAKSANPEQKAEFVSVIENVLRDIVTNGMDKKALEAGINYHEFRYREADFGNYPKGLVYLLQLFDSWLYDENAPFLHMEATETFAFLKTQLESGYFERLIQEYLIDNTHGAIITVKPERGRSARLERELAARLSDYKSSLSREEIADLVRQTRQLKDYQEADDAAADLEKIPVLSVSDISREILPVCNERMDCGGIPVVFHEIETNGIGYADLLFDLSGIPEEMLPYVGVLQAVLGMVDTSHYGYGELFNEINIHTGGIATSLELYPDVEKAEEKAFRATFEIRAKALYDKLPVAFRMMEEILTRSKLDDEKRLREILAMTASRLQMYFQTSGHTAAAQRALSYLSPMSKFRDLTSGIGYFEAVRKLEEHFEEEKQDLTARLQKLTKILFRADNLMVSYTAAKEGLGGLDEQIRKLGADLFAEAAPAERCVIHCEKRNEGFQTASKVQYVARVGNFIDAGKPYTGALQILKVILGYNYLWQNVRVKGGAYGCMNNFSRTGETYFVSYRDPNLKKTNEIYEGIPAWLRNFFASEREMEKYIIGTVSNLDQPLTPAAKGDRSMTLYMSHITEAMIRREREEVLDADAGDIRALAEIVEAVLKENYLCVIGSEETIAQQKELFAEIRSIF